MKRFLFAAALALSSAACSHVHSYNQDGFSSDAGRYISQTGEKTVWFNFNFDNSFIDQARDEFVAQCKGGTITGVSSRLSSENGVFYWKSRIHFTGLCVPTPAVALAGAGPRTRGR